MRPGQVIAGKYRLEAPIGEGGIGVVWRAVRDDIGRPVALKVLKGGHDDDQRDRFRVEAAALARLDHPGCVTLFDSGYTDLGEPFLVMEHLDGQSLARCADSLSFAVRIAVFRQVVDAVAYAHDHGVVHRDLKPDNVLLVEGEGGVVAKVLDFGLAKLSDLELNLTRTGELAGTPAYMSPEQLRGLRDAGKAADLYSLGVMLFELIEGHRPFEGGSPVEVAMGHFSASPPTLGNSECPEELASIAMRLLEKEPDRRYSDAHELNDALHRVELRETVQLPRRPRRAPRSGADSQVPTRRRPRLAGWGLPALALAIIVVFGVGVIALQIAKSDRPQVVAPISQRTPNWLDVGVANRVVDETEDAGSNRRETGAVADGCGKLPPAERSHTLQVGGSTRTLRLDLPLGYDPERRYPLVLLFHREPVQLTTDGGDLLNAGRFGDIADRHGLILVALKAVESRRPWRPSDGDVEFVDATIRWAHDNLCVDPSLLFGVGHDQGGLLLVELACERRFTAIATFNDGYFNRSFACDPAAAVPYLRLYGTKDKLVPPDGGKTCLPGLVCSINDGRGSFRDDADSSARLCNQRSVLSVDRIGALWRRRNHCSNERTPYPAPPGVKCVTWDCGDAPYVSCAVAGGHGWVAAKEEPTWFADACYRPPAEAADAQVIGQFFASFLEP